MYGYYQISQIENMVYFSGSTDFRKYSDMHISQDQYFDYGYPDYKKVRWYGLWAPTLDRFLIVHHDLPVLMRTQFLMTTKILCKILELDPELYENNIVDNTCCHQWTVMDSSESRFNMMYKDDKKNPSVKIHHVGTSTESDIVYLQDWAMFLLHWSKTLAPLDNPYERFVTNIFGIPGENSSLIDQIYQTLLLGEDQTQVTNDIIGLLYSNKSTFSQSLAKTLDPNNENPSTEPKVSY